ncbi:calcium-binding protein [Allomesorhizobium camelthorni]|uniref:Calcium-binding protein n=1 Tax=Allomesorhizobium camelthorni TaxID=475069 RepID=A0A6G4WA20_9HYPH|nr:calcium-binding protein [Mesorhizobium camelthorni]NGO51449.1 hypothetical protein [Mesorhizobium camelthorni]
MSLSLPASSCSNPSTPPSNVEILDFKEASSDYRIFATISQLSSFASIINSVTALPQLSFYIAGDGGTIDFSTRIETGSSIDVDANYSSAGVTIIGTENDDVLSGSNYNDTLNGGEGSDVIRDSGGADIRNGGAGDDRFILRTGGTVDGGVGTDTVEVSAFDSSLVLVNVEILNLFGGYLSAATASQINSFTSIVPVYFAAGQMEIRLNDGGTVDFSTKVNGMYSVNVFGSSSASAYVITGTANGDVLRGGQGNDTLNGGGGADRLDGASGADQLTGGAGNDSYYIDHAGDQIFEGAGGGSDRVLTSISYALAVGTEVELLVTTNEVGADAISLTGNTFSQQIIGNAGANVINGGGGSDTMRGLGGNDIYYVDNAGDIIVEEADGGTDTVRSYVNWTLGGNVERLELQGAGNLNGAGNTLNNTLVGNAGNNLLNGGAGNDYMVGGAGNDIFVVDLAGDSTVENTDGGTDTVRSYVNWTLGGNVERLELQGAGNLNGAGNTLNNTLVGNSGNNLLNGGAGNDYMVGGAGNDIFVVDLAGDSTVENAGGGTDTVRSFVNWTLANNVERLELQGAGNLNGAGNTLNNTLVGNAGNNLLNGGAGNDYMVGGAGNDTLTGGSGNDRLVGGAGSDILNGGTGNDTFDFDLVSDSPAGPALRDSIVGGFSHGFDCIDLATIDANTLAAGNQAFSFIGSAAFSGVAGQLRYTNYSGNVIINADLNGDSTADMQILVAGTNFMTGTDFIV